MKIVLNNPNLYPLTLSSNPSEPGLIDYLPAGMSFATPLNPVSGCGGTISAIGNTLKYIGGVIPATAGSTIGSCTFSVNVTSTAGPNITNQITAGALKATTPGGEATTNAQVSEATLLVNKPLSPTVSKAFASTYIYQGQRVALTITLRNPDLNNSISSVSLTDNLPAGVVIDANPGTTTNCGGTVSATAGGSSVSLNGGTIAKSSFCTITVYVTSTTSGSYSNIIPAGSIQTKEGVTNASPASAPLNVQTLSVGKGFSPAPVQIGSSTVLTVTLRNPTSTNVTGVSITDSLPSGMKIYNPADASTTCGGSVTAVSGSSSVSLSGGTIPAGSIASPGTCNIKVTVSADYKGTYTNTILGSAITSSDGRTNEFPASANMTFYDPGEGLTGGKSFSPNPIPLGSVSTATITIKAPGDTGITNLSLSDALPTGMLIASPANATSSCGGTLSAVSGGAYFSLTGGNIANPNSTCTLKFNVTGNQAGLLTNIIMPSNISNAENRNFANPVTGSLTVTSLSVAKSFPLDLIGVNGKSLLTIVISNSDLRQLNNVLLTDTVPSGVTPTTNTTTTCGGIVSVSGQTIALTGGTVPGKAGIVNGRCSITVEVIGKTIGTFTNTINPNQVSGVVDGTNVTITNNQSASAAVTVGTPLININKDFNPNTISGRSLSVMTITLVNPNSGSALKDIKFTDTLPQATVGGMLIGTPNGINTGTCGGTIVPSGDKRSFTYSGGYLYPGATCTLKINVTMDTEGTLTNTIPASAVTTYNSATNSTGTSVSLTNTPGLGVIKEFNPTTIKPGETSVLTITINNFSDEEIPGVSLIDTLPDGVTAASPFTVSNNTCTNSTVTAEENETKIRINGATLLRNRSCSISVSVTSSVSGSHQNCIPVGGIIVANEPTLSNKEAACSTLNVQQKPAAPLIAKSFDPAVLPVGGTSTLSFTLNNANISEALSGIAFNDLLPKDVVLASAPTLSQCGGLLGIGTGTDNRTSISFSGGSLAASSSCTISLNVKSDTAAVYDNITSTVTSNESTPGEQTATASLTVMAPPVIQKSFFPKPADLNNQPTLTLTITNPNTTTTQTITGLAFEDVLPIGMEVAETPGATKTNCGAGSVFSPQAGDSILSFSNGTVEPGIVCSISVKLKAAGGSYTNTTSSITSNNAGIGTPATDDLTVNGPGLKLTKTTNSLGFFKLGDVIAYNFNLTNTGGMILYTPFSFTDPKISSIDCGSTNFIPIGGSITCTGTYTVTSQDINAKIITNTAFATAYTTETNQQLTDLVTSNESAVTVKEEAIKLVKTSKTSSFRSANETITYAYTITNTGAVRLYGTGTNGEFMITDDKLGAPFICKSTPIYLDPGQSLTCTDKTYTVTAADVTAGLVKNTAYVSVKDSPEASTVNQSPDAVVTVYKLVGPVITKLFNPDPIPTGGISTLNFNIANPTTNAVSLTGIAFTDYLPSGMTVLPGYISTQCGGTVSDAGTTISLSGGFLPPNSSCTISVQVTVDKNGSFDNNVSVTSSNAGAGNTANDSITAYSPPLISKAFDKVTIPNNGTVKVAFKLTNPNSTGTLTGVNFSDALPEGMELSDLDVSTVGCGDTSTGFTGTIGGNNFSFTSLEVTAGTPCTLSLNLKATTPGTKYNTTGPVGSTQGGQGAPSNTATLEVSNPQLTLKKTIKSQTEPYKYNAVGQVLTYQYHLTNTGNVNLIGAGADGRFTISDVFTFAYDTANTTTANITCPALEGGLAPGDSVTCEYDYSVTQADLNGVLNTGTANISNTATAHALYDVTPVNSNQDTVLATAVQSASISLSKSGSPDPYKLAETIGYTYTIKNTGNLTVNGTGAGGIFAVTDGKGLSVTCPPATTSLASGESVACTASYVSVTQGDMDNGKITNTAQTTAKPYNSTTNLNANTSETVYADQKPALAVVKDLSKITESDGTTVSAKYDETNDLITYSYIISNTGNVTLSGPFSITDNKVNNGTAFVCGLSTTVLHVGAIETVSCTKTYNPTQADLNAGSVTNTANAKVDFTYNNTDTPHTDTIKSADDTAIAPADQNPAISLNKVVKNPAPPAKFANPGSIITYEYTINNSGNVTLTAPFTISDDHIGTPAGTRFTCLSSGTLAPGATTTCTATYTATQADTNAGSITNTAKAYNSYTYSDGTIPATVEQASSPDDASIQANQTSGLSLTKTALPISYNKANQVISYSYVIKNTGTVTIYGYDAVNLVRANFSIQDNKVTVSCPATDHLDYQGQITCTASYTTTQDDLNKKLTIKNDASTNADTVLTGDDMLNATATQSVTAIQSPAVTLTKVGTPGTYTKTNIGGSITYTYTLKNTGNITIYGSTDKTAVFTITDNKLGTSCTTTGVTYLDPNQTASCTLVYSPITQTDLDKGTIQNTAGANVWDYNGNLMTPTASEQVEAAQNPALNLTKTVSSIKDAGGASKPKFDATTDTITYSYVITNSGDVTLKGPFTLTDNKITGANISCTPSNYNTTGYSLAPGSSFTCTGSYKPIQTDLNAGKVNNTGTTTATFSSDLVTNQAVSKTANASAPADQNPAMSLTKTVQSPATIAAPGTTVTYLYTLKNTGNVTLTASTTYPFKITDDHIGSPLGTLFNCKTSGTIAPGASTTCTATYTSTQADTNAGSVTNKATASYSYTYSDGTTPVTQTYTTNQNQATITATQTKSATITKSANPTTYSAVGNVISYSYVIKNTGTVTIYGTTDHNGPFSVTDSKGLTVSCPAGTKSLDSSQSVTCTASHTITQADLNAGHIDNSSSTSIYAYTGEKLDISSNTVDVKAVQSPAFTLTKSITSGTPYTAKGQSISYQYLINNTGNVTLSGPFTLTDNKITGSITSCAIDGNNVNIGVNTFKLAPNTSFTCTATYTTNQTDVDRGSVVNTATIKNSYTKYDNTVVNLEESDSKTATATQSPAVSIEKTIKSGAIFDAEGDVVTYSYVITNSGNVGLKGPFTVTDDKIDGNAAFTCGTGSEILAPKDTLTCDKTYAVTQADLNAGFVKNTASAHVSYTNSNDETANVDSSTADATATATQSPAFTLAKSASAETYAAAKTSITYSYTITNTGNLTVYGVSANPADNGPFAITDTVTSPEPDLALSIECPPDINALEPGKSVTCTAIYLITQFDMNSGSVTNAASARVYLPSGGSLYKEATKTITATQLPAISLNKSVVPGSPFASEGDQITYKYEITNTGNVSLNGQISISDDKIGDIKCGEADQVLNPGESVSCTAIYVVEQADLDHGSVTNTATASVTYGDKEYKDTKSVTTDGNISASLGIEKSEISSGPYEQIGNTIRYQYILTNTGNVTLTGPFTITDNQIGSPKGTPFTCDATVETLALGGFVTCEAEYLVTQADLNTGSVTNLAKGHGLYNDKPVTSTEAKEIVHLKQMPILVLKKTIANGDPYNVAGGKISYQYEITNNGNVTYPVKDGVLTFTIDDDKLGQRNCSSNKDLTPNESFTCLLEYTVTQEDLDLGKVTNVAKASYIKGETVIVSNTDQITAYASQKAGLTLNVKITEGAEYSNAGDLVKYDYILTNSGNVSVSGTAADSSFVIIDDVNTVVTCPKTTITLKPGESLVCMSVHVVTQPDLERGFILNKAYGLGNEVGVVSPIELKSNESGDRARIKPPMPDTLPRTGFAPGIVTALKEESRKFYSDSGISISIPSIKLDTNVVGIPLTREGWDITWLGNQLGYLEGTAFPTLSGNSVITGHLYGADGKPGPFIDIRNLRYGDKILINGFGKTYTYEVRKAFVTTPDDTSAFDHEERSWVTLITCKSYDSITKSYHDRYIVKAVLVSIK
ncbi:MAG: sortase [Anaerolineaceae bacterium]|nr:sortase [Anaerolineaceae bacterium]